MIVVIGNGPTTSLLKERMATSSASVRTVNLYGRTVLLAWPDEFIPDTLLASLPPSAETVLALRRPYFLSSRDFKPENTSVEVGGVHVGPGNLVVAAGPCSVEGEDQMMVAAEAAKRAGAQVLRGGAFKPRTSPYSFSGLGKTGVQILKRVREKFGLPVVSEVLDVRTIPLFRDVDMLQVGTRNAQNFPLLEALGEFGRPVLLKRGMNQTLEEWLSSADYVLARGNGSLVLCERGIRTAQDGTRFSLDLGSMALAKRLSHLPVCADPSHAAGRQDLVEPLALAAVASGAHMLLIEMHPDPKSALSDRDQQITPEALSGLIRRARALVSALEQAEELEGRGRCPSGLVGPTVPLRSSWERKRSNWLFLLLKEGSSSSRARPCLGRPGPQGFWTSCLLLASRSCQMERKPRRSTSC